MKHIIKSLLAIFDLKVSKIRSVESRVDYGLADLLPILGLPENGVVIDGGANEGQTIELLLKHSRNFNIYAFEPDEILHKSLKKKYSQHDNVNISSCALVNEEGNFDFNIYDSTKLSSIKDLNSHSAQASKLARTTVIKGITLDSFVASNAISKVDLLKLDLQGFEYEALLGSQSLLQNGVVDWIFVEVMFGDMYSNGSDESYNYLNILKYLSDNYTLYTMIDFNYSDNYQFSHCDLLFKRITKPSK